MRELENRVAEELPEPDALTILFRVAVTHWMKSLPKDEALKILHGMAEDLANEHSLSNVLLMRPPPEQGAVNRERRRACAMFRRFAPVWLAAIDEDE